MEGVWMEGRTSIPTNVIPGDGRLEEWKGYGWVGVPIHTAESCFKYG